MCSSGMEFKVHHDYPHYHAEDWGHDLALKMAKLLIPFLRRHHCRTPSA
ncbi:hypothetical protein GJ698_10360 [Pseudoduganella sp. FT26W]|uniref:Uncharacterized protein n=1 Tax=Duganella aquatilis TaxID=2666082 RepID=A0A844CUP3_9BURK|nr:hypothetical protein [Duganella aquatilis]MRW84487.1 hypothetical protein [Duganella aquatilis]